jgi:hypothetical protein
MSERTAALTLALGVASAIVFVAVFAVAPKDQPQGYHHFADTAPLGPIPNALNVLSNVAFLAVGLWGLAVVLSPRAARAFDEPWERQPYVLFFAAIAATAFGSAWYHRNPSDQTLFWDRLPMTVAFTSLVALVFTGGHPLKHLAAAAGTACLGVMLLRRRGVPTATNGGGGPTGSR